MAATPYDEKETTQSSTKEEVSEYEAERSEAEIANYIRIIEHNRDIIEKDN